MISKPGKVVETAVILNEAAEKKLEVAQNIWFGTVRPDGRPHLVPVWFVWSAGSLYACIDANSVKAKNLATNPKVVLALEDGSNPVICEGQAAQIHQPYPDEAVQNFLKKYDWDIRQDTQYQMLVQVTPEKWMLW